MWMSSTVILGWLTGPNTFEYDYSSINFASAGASGSWSQNVLQMTCGDIPQGSTPVLFLGGHGYNTTPGVIYMDNVEVELLSTSVASPDEPAVSFGPNPATDKLWVDLPEVPLSITAIDATGRMFQLHSFQQTGRTLEVEVSSVRPGLCVLLMKTASGIRTLRFLKV